MTGKVILQTVDGEKVVYNPQLTGVKSLPAIPCLRCGTCCTKWQPPVDEDEIATIAKALNMPVDKFYKEYIQEYPLRPKTYLLRCQDNTCVFLKYESNMANCLIHPFKPVACCNWTPSLSRRECQEGLKKWQRNGSIILPTNSIYHLKI